MAKKLSPITRDEEFYAAISGEDVRPPHPVTRREQYLAKAAGEDVATPEPITREEVYLDEIAKGGGSSVDVTPITITENGVFTAPAGTAYSPVTVEVSGGGEEGEPIYHRVFGNAGHLWCDFYEDGRLVIEGDGAEEKAGLGLSSSLSKMMGELAKSLRVIEFGVGVKIASGEGYFWFAGTDFGDDADLIIRNMRCVDIGRMFYGSNYRSITFENCTMEYVYNQGWFENSGNENSVIDMSGVKLTSYLRTQSLFKGFLGKKVFLPDLSTLSGSSARYGSISEMFSGCANLEEIVGLEKLPPLAANGRNPSAAEAFKGCEKLKEIDLGDFAVTGSYTLNVTDMFSGCSSLEKIYVSSNWANTKLATTATGTFDGCTALVGGNGTAFDPEKTDYTMAHADTAADPGYFTLKE